MMLFLEEVCSNQNILAVIYFVWTIVSWVLRIVPIVLIVMVSLDFAKNVMANGADAMNKNLKMVISRIISCILCFLVPSFVTTLNTILGDFGVNYSNCLTAIANGVHVDNNSGSLIEDSGNDNKPNVNIGGGSSVKPSSGVSGGGSSSSGGDSVLSKSNLSKLKSYKDVTILDTITKEESQKKVSVVGEKHIGIAQGFCVTNDYFITAQINSSNTKALIQMYNKNSGKQIKSVTVGNFHHANGMAYNKSNDSIYVALNDGKKYLSFPLSDLKSNGKITSNSHQFSKSISGIAYDRIYNQYYFAKGGRVYVADSNFKLIRTIKKIRSGIPQDIGGYNGIIMVVVYLGSSEGNAIDLYRFTDGAYLGSYKVKFPGWELESVDYYGTGNTFSIYFNTHGNSKNYIYNTDKINFNQLK